MVSPIETNHEPQSEEIFSAQSQDCLSPITLIITWIWILGVVFGRLIAEALLTSLDTRSPNWQWAIFPLIQAVLLALPLLPLSWVWRNSRYKTIFQTWLAAAGLSLTLLPMHLAPAWAYQTQTLILIIFTAAYSFLTFRLFRPILTIPKDSNMIGTRGNFLSLSDRTSLGITLSLIFGIPWAIYGALGSPLDTLLSILAGSVLGIFATILINTIFSGTISNHRERSVRDYLWGGFASGVVLLLISAGIGYSFGLMQILFAISIPVFGWIAFSLSSYTHSRHLLPAAVLIGTAFSVSLGLFDPDELALIINATNGEILWFAAKAALQALGIGLVSSICLIILLWIWRSRRPIPGWFPTAGKIAMFGAIGIYLASYFLFGQPGFYGEDIFVILEDQIDPFSDTAAIDPIERREAVYVALTAHAVQSQSEIRRSLDRFGIAYQPYYLVNGLHVQGGPLIRLWLSTRQDVDRVLDNPQLRPLVEQPPTASGTDIAPNEPQWNLKLIQADRVWDDLGVNGEGILVGQSDSGVQGDHPELAASYRGRTNGDAYAWLDPWNNYPAPVDIGGHGTHTLGSILGTSTGVAPGAEWIACVNLARNLGNPAYYLDCMQFMLAPYPQDGDPFRDGVPKLGAQILNNSWGCPPLEGCDQRVFQPAMRALREAGVFVVASAGNDGPGCSSLDSPIAIYDEVFSTGAIDRFGELAFFSSLGPVENEITTSVKPDIVAPGVDVLSSYPNNTYFNASGTSMAGPHVVGVVALMWSANTDLIGDIETTEQILAETAMKFDGTLPQCPGADETPSTAVGYGILNAFAAVERAIEISPTR